MSKRHRPAAKTGVPHQVEQKKTRTFEALLHRKLVDEADLLQDEEADEDYVFQRFVGHLGYGRRRPRARTDGDEHES